jgi:hypothetical protein
MSLTRLLGVLVLAVAATILVVSFLDVGAQYATVPQLTAQAEQLGLDTTTTNLRFGIGAGMIVDVVVVLALAVVGWWLTTCETQQFAYLYVAAAILIASVVVRTTPVVPLSISRYSPRAFFFGAQVTGSVVGDETARWVIIPQRPNLRLATVTPLGQTEGGAQVILDFGLRQDLLSQYLTASPPLPLKGLVMGTHSIAAAKELHCLPTVRVQGLSR